MATSGRPSRLIGLTVTAIVFLTGLSVDIAAANPSASPTTMPTVQLPATPFSGYRQIKTRHFVFIYEPRDHNAAERLASFAEQVYGRLTLFLHSAPQTINCLLVSRIDAANGYFTPLPPHHLVLYLTSPDTPAIGARTEDWLKLLFTHELTHYIHLVYDRGFFHALSRLFGGTASSGHGIFLPGWTVEGIAVNTETLFTSGGRGRNPYFALYYRALALEDRMFALGQAGYDAYGRPEGRVYLAGYLLIDYIMTHYGEESFYRIHDDFVRFPFAGLNPAVKRETGHTLQELYDAMIAELQQRFAPARSLPLGSLESPRLTGDYYLPVSTRQGLFEYRELPDRRPEIVRVDPATRETVSTVTAPLTDPSSFAMTPNGQLLVFSAYALDAAVAGGPDTTADLYLHDGRTGRTRRLTWNAHLTQPAVSPDGSVVVALQQIGPHRRLVLLDGARSATAGSLQLLYSDHRADLFNPVFSPDGKRIAFVRNLAGRQTVVEAALSDLHPIPLPENRAVPLQTDVDLNRDVPRNVAAVHPGEEYFPSYADNRTIIFTGDTGGTLNLYQVDRGTGDVYRILEDRVGIARGIRFAGGILYQSVSATGTVVRFQDGASVTLEPFVGGPTQPFVGGPTQPFVGGPTPSPIVTPGFDVVPPVSSSPYVNGAPPDFWLPYPTFTRSSQSAIEVGPALLTYGANVTGTFAWMAYGGFYPTLLQPTGGFQLDLTRGAFGFGYTVSQQYGIDVSPFESLSTPVQNTTQRIDFTLSPIASVILGATRALSFSTAVVYSIDRTALQDFNFADGTDPGRTSGSQALILGASMSYRSEALSAPLDLYRPGSFGASTAATVILPVLGQSYRGVHLIAGLRGSFRSFAPLQSIGMTLDASYDSGEVPTYRSVAPPGFTALRQSGSALDTPGIAMALVRYGFTIASTDLPLPFDSGLAAVGASIFAAYSIGFDPGTNAFGASSSGTVRLVGDERTVAGFDLTFMLARNTVMIPLKMGAAVRFDPTFKSAPGFPADFGFFLSIGGYSVFSAERPRGAASSGLLLPAAFR